MSFISIKEKADIFLEKADLLFIDDGMTIIKVDKSIFDDFVKDSYINISFVDYNANEIYSYIMIDENDESITMQLFC